MRCCYGLGIHEATFRVEDIGDTCFGEIAFGVVCKSRQGGKGWEIPWDYYYEYASEGKFRTAIRQDDRLIEYPSSSPMSDRADAAYGAGDEITGTKGLFVFLYMRRRQRTHSAAPERVSFATSALCCAKSPPSGQPKFQPARAER